MSVSEVDDQILLQQTEGVAQRQTQSIRIGTRSPPTEVEGNEQQRLVGSFRNRQRRTGERAVDPSREPAIRGPPVFHPHLKPRRDIPTGHPE